MQVDPILGIVIVDTSVQEYGLEITLEFFG